MNKVKEFLAGSALLVGSGFRWFLSLLLLFAPLFFVLDFKAYIDGLIIVAVLFVPFLGGLLELAIWGWSLIVAVKMPFDIFIGIYYAALALYVFTKLVPVLLSLIATLFSER